MHRISDNVNDSAIVANRNLLFDITDYGAKGDGESVDTNAIQQTIDACHKAGGGTVWFPCGHFLSGTLHLKSRVTLLFSAGAVLLASVNQRDYSMNHLIYAEKADTIGFTGAGVINGQSSVFREKDPSPPSPGEKRNWAPSPLIELIDCSNVRFESLMIRQAPRWTLRPKNCDGVKIRGISILNDLNVLNSDGIDIDSSRNVIISDCHIEAGDDCIVLKTTDRKGPPESTENVAVTNCLLVSSTCALKLGTESHGDFRHCVFSNCVIRNSPTGIALLAKDGGSMESVRFNNIVITTANTWGPGVVEWPIIIDSEQRYPNSLLSEIRDISLNDITIYGFGRILVQGQPQTPVESLALRNLTIRVTGYEKIDNARKAPGSRRRENLNALDLGDKPAAFILAHIKGLIIDGTTLNWPDIDNPPSRHVVYGQDLENIDLRGLRGSPAGKETEAYQLVRCRSVDL